MELMFILLFRYIKQMRAKQLQKLAEVAAQNAAKVAPIVTK
jgi:hypothetical protein